jgi:aldehyde:ferredoxin oxidoreductase
MQDPRFERVPPPGHFLRLLRVYPVAEAVQAFPPRHSPVALRSVGVDPLSPDNVLVFATGVTTGVPLTGFCRHSVVAKSPLTNGFGEAEAVVLGAEVKVRGFRRHSD